MVVVTISDVTFETVKTEQMLWEIELHNDEAEELKTKIENAEKSINVSDNTQETAENAINEALNNLKNQGSTLKIQSLFKDFDAPTSDTPGNIDFESTILSKDDDALAQTESISWKLNLVPLKIDVDNSSLQLTGTTPATRTINNNSDLINLVGNRDNNTFYDVDLNHETGVITFTGKANGSSNYVLSADNADSITIPVTASVNSATQLKSKK